MLVEFYSFITTHHLSIHTPCIFSEFDILYQMMMVYGVLTPFSTIFQSYRGEMKVETIFLHQYAKDSMKFQVIFIIFLLYN